MPESQFSKFLKNRTNRIGFILLLFLVFVSGFFLMRSAFVKKPPPPIGENQIKLQRGEDVIIVNKNGLVEYHSTSGVYYETWDSARISSFFSSMEAKAKQKKKGDCKYKVTMYVNGKLVEFCLDSSDSEMQQVYQEYDSVVGSGSISDLFPTGGEDGDLDNVQYFPTSIPIITVFPTPTTAASGGQTNYPPVQAGCDVWSSLIVRNRAIISNTYCTVAPTPTP